MGRALAGLSLLVATVAHGAVANPFLNREFYVNPVNSAEYQSSIDTAKGITRANLEKMQQVPSAYWIDQKAKVRGNSKTTVEGILKDASSKSPPQLVVLIWYDLPNRDCDAKASNGEICCKENDDGTCDYLAQSDCADGIKEYKTGYVDPFVSVLKEYHSKLPVVLVMEPDGLANLATNIADPHCGNMATQTAYKEGVAYAVRQITTQAPSVSIYLDAAHGGWLGWENNLKKFITMLKGLDMPLHKVRGFATNVANYQALGVQCPWCPDQGFRNGFCLNNRHGGHPCCEDPCSLLSQWNFGNNELNYAQGLVAAANGLLGMDAHVIIDTGRNGVTNQRSDCANWCNPRGAGAGVPSTVHTANTSLVDAYYWLKTPGESDGCSEILPSGKKCPRFDAKCGSLDSIGSKPGEPRCTEAGMWFDYQVKQLAANAHFQPPVANSSAQCDASVPPPPPPPQLPVPSTTKLPATLKPATKKPAAAGVPGPVTTEPATTKPVAAPVACARAFEQCGGIGFGGPTCCEGNCGCTSRGDYYSQCTPPPGQGVCGASPSSSSISRTASPATTAAPFTLVATTTLRPLAATSQAPPHQPFQPFSWDALASVIVNHQRQHEHEESEPKCAVPYSQCGGSLWNGPTCCDVYCECRFMTSARSECWPRLGAGALNRDKVIVRKDEQYGALPELRPRGPFHSPLVRGISLTAGLVGLSTACALAVRLAWRRPRRYNALEAHGPSREAAGLPLTTSPDDVEVA